MKKYIPVQALILYMIFVISCAKDEPAEPDEIQIDDIGRLEKINLLVSSDTFPAFNFSYDSNSNISKLTIINSPFESAVKEIVFTRNSNCQITHYSVYGDFYERYDYIIGSDGKYLSAEGHWNYTTIIETYTYSGDHIIEVDIDRSFVINSKEEVKYTYDNHGNIIQMRRYSDDGSFKYTDFTYDAKINPVKSLTLPFGSVDSPYYSHKNNLLSIKYTYSEGSLYTGDSIIYKYTYNAANLPETAVLKYYYTNDTSEQKYVYVYE